jgi:hypothetical protein
MAQLGFGGLPVVRFEEGPRAIIESHPAAEGADQENVAGTQLGLGHGQTPLG